DMFVAGTNTSTTEMEWAMSELLRKPYVTKKVQDEIELVVGNYRTSREGKMSVPGAVGNIAMHVRSPRGSAKSCRSQ
ncbi:hypothetical protein KI387_013189, partial [Taxus chinensis]